MKYCPECGFQTDDQEFNFCPVCSDRDGKGMVKLLSRKTSDTQVATKESDSESFSGFTMGMGSVVGGGVVITDNSKRVVKELSEAERIKKNKDAFREECEKRCKDGLVSQEDKIFLEKFRDDLGLEKHFADEILKKAKAQSVRRISTLPDTVKLQINQTKEAIAANNILDVKKDLEALEQYKSQIDNNELDQLFYQLKAILAPGAFTINDEDYWSHFWSYVIYRKQNSPKADEVLASLHRWDSHYPAQNQMLLYTMGLLMQNHIAEAQTAFKKITPGFDSELLQIYETLDNMLGREWYGDNDDVPPRFKFYAESLFKNAYESLKDKARADHARRLEKEAAERMNRAEEDYRREKFLEVLSSNNGDINGACLASGITKAQLSEWRESIPRFNHSIEILLDFLIQMKQFQEQEAIREAEKARQLADTKDKFKKLYESNSCDALKTCAEIGLDSGTVYQWRRDDASFNEALQYIERQHAYLIRKEECAKRKEKAKKVAPFVLIFILLCALGVGLLLHKRAVEAEEAEKTRIELTQQAVSKYESRIEDFKQALGNADNSHIEALRIASEIFVDIREMEETELLAGKNESSNLRKDFNTKANKIQQDLQKLVSSAGQLESSDSEGARLLKEEEENLRKVKDYINTVAK